MKLNLKKKIKLQNKYIENLSNKGESIEDEVVMVKNFLNKSKANFKCLMCTDIFTSKEAFKKQKRKHQKEIDQILHKCEYCPKSFFRKPDLIDHMQNQCKGEEPTVVLHVRL